MMVLTLSLLVIVHLVTIKNEIPMLHIDDLMDEVHGAKFFLRLASV